MRFLVYPALFVAAAGCAGNSYSQKDPDEFGDIDSADTGDRGADADTDTDADSDSDADSDTDTDADSDADTDADTDADSDTDTDTTTSSLCTNAWDPLDVSGYSRDYDITVNGTPTDGRQEGWGTGWTTDGDRAWVMYDEVNDSTFGWSGSIYVTCDAGHNPGLYIAEWDMTIGSLGAADTVLSTPRMYLPADYLMGGVGTWSYAYDLDVDAGMGFPYTLHVSGEYEELGTESVTLFDGSTYDAYHLGNTYSMTDDYGLVAIDGYLEQWWVEGLGLVSEINTNTGDGSTIMTRDLAAYTALTPR